jgi:hypothetical protein
LDKLVLAKKERMRGRWVDHDQKISYISMQAEEQINIASSDRDLQMKFTAG